MRIKITIDAKNLTLPYNYLHIIQAIIYNSLPAEYASFLHDQKKFKYFNFSSIQGRKIISRFNENSKIITFTGHAHFYISSLYKDLILLIIDKFKETGYIKFGNYHAPIINVEEIVPNIENNKINIRALTPIEVHRTVDKKTIYYNPLDKEYFNLLNINFANKIESNNVELLKFYNVHNITKVIKRYKGFIIESYYFECTIEADEVYLNALFSLGLGSRNSYGFGMIEII